MSEEVKIYNININDIVPNRFQPRLVFDHKSLEELALSIKQVGIIQPVVVRKCGIHYEIVAGERRVKAAQIANLETIPAIIMELGDKETAEVAILENIHRADLTSIEEARAYKQLLDEGYLKQEQLAARMGKNQSTISNKLRLLKLTNEVQEALLNNAISERHARSLISIKSADEQINMLNEIITNKLNVRDTEYKIKEYLSKKNMEINLEQELNVCEQNENKTPITSGIPDLNTINSGTFSDASGLSPINVFYPKTRNEINHVQDDLFVDNYELLEDEQIHILDKKEDIKIQQELEIEKLISNIENLLRDAGKENINCIINKEQLINGVELKIKIKK